MFPHFLVLNDDGHVQTSKKNKFTPRSTNKTTKLNKAVELPVTKERAGLVVGKRGEWFDDDALRVIDGLAKNNFAIHTTCKVNNCSMLDNRKGVINHPNLTSDKYSKLMLTLAFNVGIGNPIISPSPIIGLAMGIHF